MRFDRTAYRRLVGVATLAYGATVLLRPNTMTKPAGLAPTKRNTNFARAIGARDTLSGIALLAAKPAQADAAVAARVLSDASDVVVFGLMCPKSTKLKVMAIAGGYGALCSLAHSRVG